MLKNKYDLMFCQSRLHTTSEIFVRHKKFGSGSIFCVFASVACILIGKDGEYEKMEKRMRKFWTQCAMAFTPDFSQHANMRAVSQYMENKVYGVTYLKK